MIAKFREKQPEVKIIELESDAYVYLHLNEREIVDEDTKEKCYEYDYYEFSDKIENINPLDIRFNPTKYIHYIKVNKSDKELIVEQQKQIDMLTKSVLEMSKILYTDKKEKVVSTLWSLEIMKQRTLEEAKSLYQSCSDSLKEEIKSILIDNGFEEITRE